MNCFLSAAAWLLLAAAAAAQVPTPRFESGVELVEVTMVVRDRAGRPVTDLRPEEITIRDKGVVQRIVAFARISVPVVPAPEAPPLLEARDVSTNERIGESRVFMLVLDALHVGAVNALAVRRHAREFIERNLGPNDLAGVFSPGGLPAATEDFTTDKARLIAAVDQFNGTKLPSATVGQDREARSGGTAAHGGKDPDEYERADRAQVLAGVLQALATNAERIGARRKTLLLFSEGTDYDINLPGDVMRAMDAAVKSLVRADVSVYAINPRGPRVPGEEQTETPIYNELPVPGTISSEGLEQEYRNSLASLRYLAELTGGFSVADRTEMGPAFDRVLRDSSDYYVLAYEPIDRPRPGEFRRIEVRTSRPGMTVVARKGYSVRAAAPAPAASSNPFATQPAPSRPGRPAGNLVTDPLAAPSPKPASPAPDDELKQLLANPLPKAGLPLRLQAIPFKGSGSKAVVRLVVEILGGALQFVERRGRSEERIELALLTVDAKGRQSNGRSTTIDLSLPPEELQRVKASGVRWLSKLELPPGRHQVRIAARAARTGATGSITQTLEVPRYDSSRPAMSGVTMTSLPAIVMPTRGTPWTEKTLQTPPSAARLFAVGDQVTAVVHVYPGPSQGEEASIFGELSSPGSKPVRVPSYVRTGSDPATREAAFQIDTRELPPGEYVLRVVCARRGGDGVERRVPFEIARSR